MAYEMTSEDFSIYSDTYKDAYGFRPRTEPKFASKEDFLSTIDSMIAHYIAEDDREKADQNNRYDSWIKSIHQRAVQLNLSVKDVVRWEFESHDLRVSSKHDRESFCFTMGFSFDEEKVIAKIR